MLHNQDPKLNKLDRPGHPDGMTVPDGYFEQFAERMSNMLPPNELEMQPVEQLKPRTRWQKIRPFVYMAAMFAGIWCTMKMFTMMQSPQAPASTDQLTPAQYYAEGLPQKSSPLINLASASESQFDYYDYIWSDYNEADLLEDLYDAGYDASSLTF